MSAPLLPRTLEAVVPPDRVVWLAAHAADLSPACRVRVAGFIGLALVERESTNFEYAKEVARVHAAVCDVGDTDRPAHALAHATPASARRGWCTGQDEGVALALRRSIVAGTATADDVRMYAYQLAQARLASSACPREELVAGEPTSPRVRARVANLFRKFGEECTFKVHSDACIHHELFTCALSPWTSALLARYETPYPMAVFAYPDTVNAVVRPVLETPTRHRVGAMVFSKHQRAPSVIQVYHLLAEVVGRSEFVVLGNHNQLRHPERTFPLPLVVREASGEHRVGYRTGSTHTFVPAGTPLDEVVCSFLRASRAVGYVGTREVCAAILDEGDGRNALSKYII